MKNSGVDWIGEIPAHWEVKRLKSIFSECKDLSSTGDEDLLSVSEYYGVARRLDIKEDDEFDSRADSLEGYKICKKNDPRQSLPRSYRKENSRVLGRRFARRGYISLSYEKVC